MKEIVEVNSFAKATLKASESLISEALGEEGLRVYMRELRALTWLADQRLEDMKRQKISKALTVYLGEPPFEDKKCG